MRPKKPFFDAANSGRFNAVVCGNIFVRPWVVANGPNLFFGKFRSIVPFTTKHSAVPVFITHIPSVSIPAEIGKFIVPFVSVIMAAVRSLLGMPTEGDEDKAVSFVVFYFAALPQKCAKIAGWLAARLVFYFMGLCRANTAMVRDLVKTLIADDLEPSFHTPYVWKFAGVL